MDLGATLLTILTGFIVKGMVMIGAGWLVVRVGRATYAKDPRQLWMLVPAQERDSARLLFYSLVCFAISEVTCGIEMYILARALPGLDALHSVTSAAGMALFALGLYRVFDRQTLRFTASDCVARRMCGTCTVRTAEGCKLRVTLLFFAAFVVLVSILPLFASTQRMNVDLHHYALPFPRLNAWYDTVVVPLFIAYVPGYSSTGEEFFFPTSTFILEFRVIPVIALVLSLAAVGCYVTQRLERGMDALMLAVGAIAYVYFELVLYRGTDDLLLGSLGHEVGELWFLLFTAEFLPRCMPPTRGAVRGRDGVPVAVTESLEGDLSRGRANLLP